MAEAEGLKDSVYVADYLDIPLRTLDQWAYRGIGPSFYKIGRHRRYRMDDVEQWLRNHATTSPAA